MAEEMKSSAASRKQKEPETLESLLYCWAQALVTAVVGVVLPMTNTSSSASVMGYCNPVALQVGSLA